MSIGSLTYILVGLIGPVGDSTYISVGVNGAVWLQRADVGDRCGHRDTAARHISVSKGDVGGNVSEGDVGSKAGASGASGPEPVSQWSR
jgi:hypothetical protein